MNKKVKNIVISVLFVALLSGLLLGSIIAPDKAVSASERRPLTQLPDFSWKALFDGSLFADLDDYTLDQFLMRDSFRAYKAFVKLKLFNQMDNNGVYVIDGEIFKLDYPLNPQSVKKVAAKYNELVNKYFPNADVFYSVIPDKNFFVSDESGYLKYDYDQLVTLLKDNLLPTLTYLDVFDKLSAKDYYSTDLHWKQPNILPVADALLTGMNAGGLASDYVYDTVTVDKPFYGSYYGQLALKGQTDQISYLTNPLLQSMTVYSFDDKKNIPMYNANALTGIDGYDLFLGGAKSLLTITNPNCTNGKHLVVFRDSFGSSISPLLATNYSKVTLVDIRYISSQLLAQFIDMDTVTDVLFMLNSQLINNSSVLK